MFRRILKPLAMTVVAFALALAVGIVGSTGASAALPIPEPAGPPLRAPGQVIQGPWTVKPSVTPAVPSGIATKLNSSLAMIIPSLIAIGGQILTDMSANLNASQTDKCYQDSTFPGTGIPAPFLSQSPCSPERQAEWDARHQPDSQLTEPVADQIWEELSGQDWGPAVNRLIADYVPWTPMAYGNTAVEVGAFTAPSTLELTQIYTPGTQCGKPFEPACAESDKSKVANQRAGGMCKKLDGTFSGLGAGNSSIGAMTDYPGITGTVSKPWCDNGGALVWIRWKDTANYWGYGLQPGGWINPDPELAQYATATITNNVNCKARDGSGSTITISNTTTGQGLIPAVTCPAGYVADSGEVVSGMLGVAPKPITSWGIPDTARQQYPECIGLQAVGCGIAIQVDGSMCVIGNGACADWAGLHQTNPERVKCFWGPYEMSPTQCNALTNAYQPGAEQGVQRFPGQDAGAAPAPYYNPQYNPNPNPNPSPSPSVSPSPNPSPSPSVSPSPGTDPVPSGGFPTTGTNPAGNNCLNPHWSWNPTEWVENPIVCGLVRAFVPTIDVGARSTELADAAKNTVPISWISKPMVGPSGGGCPNWTINVEGLSKNVVCDSSFTAAIVGSRGPMFALVASAMLWPLIRGIWYALIPIVRVTPTGHK